MVSEGDITIEQGAQIAGLAEEKQKKLQQELEVIKSTEGVIKSGVPVQIKKVIEGIDKLIPELQEKFNNLSIEKSAAILLSKVNEQEQEAVLKMVNKGTPPYNEEEIRRFIIEARKEPDKPYQKPEVAKQESISDNFIAGPEKSLEKPQRGRPKTGQIATKHSKKYKDAELKKSIEKVKNILIEEFEDTADVIRQLKDFKTYIDDTIQGLQGLEQK